MLETLTVFGAVLTLSDEGLVIERKTGRETVPYTDITATRYIRRLALPGAIEAVLPDGARRFGARPGGLDAAQMFRHALDERVGLGAFAASGTLRSPYRDSRPLSSSLSILFVTPFTAGMALIGGALFVSATGAVFGAIIIALALAIEALVIRASAGQIAGSCPVCGKELQASRRAKTQFCFKCRETIHIRADYFEY
ncbi:MAG: hypothetical protein LBK41_00810 [Clostridiales bacterium]|jgi:hypothetical protein|nr:hypothetical protein [Clostridiales bacterium]